MPDELEAQLLLQTTFEEQITPRLASVLIRQGAAVADAYARDANDHAAVSLVMGAARETLTPLLAGHLYRVALAFADHTYRALGLKAAGEAEFRTAAQRWAREWGAQQVVRINETTMRQIQEAVQWALQERLGQDNLAAALRDKINGVGNLTAAQRAKVIARTETHNAATYGADEAAQRTGLEYRRTWLSVGDARTRNHHISAHGQERGPREPFTVGGASLMRPGDPSAPAAQVVNCRCVLRYRPAAFARQPVPPPIVAEPATPPRSARDVLPEPDFQNPEAERRRLRALLPEQVRLVKTRLGDVPLVMAAQGNPEVMRQLLLNRDSVSASIRDQASLRITEADAALHLSRTKKTSHVYLSSQMSAAEAHALTRGVSAEHFSGGYLRGDLAPGQALARSRDKVLYKVEVPKGTSMLSDDLIKNPEQYRLYTGVTLPRDYKLVVQKTERVVRDGETVTVIHAKYEQMPETVFRPTFINPTARPVETGDPYLRRVWTVGIQNEHAKETLAESIKALKRLPEGARKALCDTTVIIAKDASTAHVAERFGTKYDNFAGLFTTQYQTCTVYLNNTMTPGAKAHVMLHELGHALDNRMKDVLGGGANYHSQGAAFEKLYKAVLKRVAADNDKNFIEQRLGYWLASPWEMLVETIATVYGDAGSAGAGYNHGLRRIVFGDEVFDYVKKAVEKLK